MTKFVRAGNTFKVIPDGALDLHKSLPVGTYTVRYDVQKDEFYLETVPDMEMPSRVYGDTAKTSDRIYRTFESRESSTGVLLTGEKGSGKTMLAKMLSIRARRDGISTIVINDPWLGENFNTFLQSINDPTVIVFDEFEKVYSNKDGKQDGMLTLLDGVYQSKKLFVLTCNNTHLVNEHMHNRPGRLYYRLDYQGLDSNFVTEYANENLVNKSHVEALSKMPMLFTEFNFDMLKAMVEEMNRYDESPQEVMEFLNTRPAASDATHKIKLVIDGVTVRTPDKVWHGNPVAGEIEINYWSDKKKGWDYATFDYKHMVKMDQENGSVLFEKGKSSLTLTRQRPKKANYSRVLTA